jgi:predicted nucleotidyltransferase
MALRLNKPGARRKPIGAARDPILRELADALRERFGAHIRDIILFGSRARGDQEEGSDYDVMVLVDVKTAEMESEVFQLGCELDFRHNVCTSVFVEEESLFDDREYEPLFINVRREGIPL